MGGVYHYPTGQWYICRSRLSQTTQYHLVSFVKPKGDISINNLELCAHLEKLALFCPQMALLYKIPTRVDNTAVVR